LNPVELDHVWVYIELQHLEPIEKEEDYDENSALINIYDLLMKVYPKDRRKDAVIECTSFNPYYDKISCSIRENKKRFDISISSCEDIPHVLVKLSDKLYPKKLKMAVREPAIYERHILYLTRVSAGIYPYNSEYIPILKIKPLSPDNFETGVGIIYGDGRSRMEIASAFKYAD